MNENRSKRREWVKTAAIIFLSIMLVLTFFSQTILNHSLPEVATKYVQNGTITTKIRGNGMIESGDPYVIEIPGIYVGRKVSSIKFKVGDKVEKGDILFYLADGDGSELEMAKEELASAQESLESAQEAYDLAILNVNITSADISSANANVSPATYRQMITNLQNSLKEAKDKVEPLETAVAQLEQAITDCNTQINYEEQQKSLAFSRAETAQTAYDQAQSAETDAKSNYSSAKEALDAANLEMEELENAIAAGTVPEEEAVEKRTQMQTKVTAAEDKKKTTKDAWENAKTALETASKDLENAIKNRDEKNASQNVNNITNLKNGYEMSKYGYEKDLAAARENVSKLQEDLNELVGKISDINNLQSLQENIDSMQKEVNKRKQKVAELEAEVSGSAITSDISGTVTEINVVSGKQITTQDVFVLQPEGQGYYMSFSVTNDQAKTLSVGDRASLVNSWYYNDMDIVLQSIKPDKTDPGKKKVLTFGVSGDATAGQNISVSVGQRSQNYDYIVPNSAIKEDNNGKFILIVESRNSPVGNRYIATRVDVQVLASDDTQSAISGAISGWEYVITTSSKPINPGDQVRMSDN